MLSHGQTFRSGTISFPALSSVDSGFPRLASGVNCDTLGDMLCHKCHERNATIHLTFMVDDKMIKRDLCEICGKEFADPFKVGNSMDSSTVMTDGPHPILFELIAASDPRYAKEAYVFLAEGMNKAREKKFGSVGVIGHLSAAEILGALRELAVENFGKAAKATFNGWGIFQCEDFGQMVFNLVEARLLAKQEQDSEADLYGGYDFNAAFPS